ncbi:hypothetical protein LguiA_012030 [Lonicera macranthoides]
MFRTKSRTLSILRRQQIILFVMLQNLKETPQAHVFKVNLPRVKKEEVMVEVEDDKVLQIKGERNMEVEEKNDT